MPGLFEQFPYTNLHELNLDWIIKILKEVKLDNETVKEIIPLIEEIYTRIHQLENLPEEFEDLEEEVHDKINELETYIDLHLKPLSNIICLTDSYGTDNPDTDRVSWCTYLCTKLELTPNVNYRKIYASGASFGDDDTTKNFYNIFVNGTSTMTTEQKTLVTDIIIEGGINEWNESNILLKDNMRALNTYIRNNFPNANINLFFCGWSKLANVRFASMGDANSTFNLYNAMCNELKWNYVFNNSALIVNDSYIDNTHPVSRVSREIADIIYEALLHKNTSVSFNTNVLYPVEIVTSSATRTLGRIYFDGKQFVLNPITFSADSISDLAGGFSSSVKIGKIVTNAVIGYDADSATSSIAVPCKLGYKIGTTWSEIDVRASFKFENGEVNLYLSNNGCFNPIPSPALSNILDTYILMPQVFIPTWD